MKICVFGAGAIGGFVGVLLARAGHEVSFVARGAHLAAMRAGGARLLIDGQELVVRVRCTDDARELGPQDYVLITMKAHSVPAAVDSIVALLGPETAIVTAVNGIPYWYFHNQGSVLDGITLESIDPGGRQMRLLGPQRAIGCVLNPAAELIAPGVIRHVHGRKFPIGEPDGQRTSRIERLHRAMQDAGLEAPVRTDIRDEIWLKLWGNLCLSPISALTHATLDVVTTDPGTRSVCRAMMLEAQLVAERIGVRLRVDADRRLDGASAIGPHKISMLVDLESGRPMEIEPIVTVVQEIAQRLSVATPTIDVVAALIKLRQKTAQSDPVSS
ncbi:MAG TPA: 2-dehydropantoate 2-reductase [Burkholderiaceae bacterium]|nr:2-dehydropantoate 2-reductase [Burkholderiaceae bacterium]